MISGSGQALWVRRLTLQDFRSHKRVDMELGRAPVILVGANGAGKTNILEAVSCLGGDRGLRSASHKHMARYPKEAWKTTAQLEGPGGSLEVSVAGTPQGRQARIGGKKCDLKTLACVQMLWLTPQMEHVQGVLARRELVDRLVMSLDPHHIGRKIAYARALKQRNHLLGTSDSLWLDSVENSLARLGVALTAARARVIEQINRALQGHTKIVLDGALEEKLASESAVDCEAFARETFRQKRHNDAVSGRTSLGPHLSRVEIFQKNLFCGIKTQSSQKNFFCEIESLSSGERKGALLKILLAHTKLVFEAHGAIPLLLLDEVAAHLDSHRRACLFDDLLNSGAQLWMSGTEKSIFAPLHSKAQFFHVSEDVRPL